MPEAAGHLAIITLANPALLWGATACAAPVIIHLILRSRPRRQPFPALQFLMASRRVSVRRHRLRHLLLLLLRMLAILLLVAALTRPVSRGSWISARSRGKTAAVFLIDDSASMTYRFEGRSRLERARAWARQLILDRNRFPGGSTFMVFGCHTPPRDVRWESEREDALRDLRSVEVLLHDRTLADGITRALERLAQARLPRTEVYILTDMTDHTWSGLADGRWSDAPGVAVFVLDVGDDEDVNTRLGPLHDFDGRAPARTPIRLQATVSTGDAAFRGRVEADVDGVVVARSEPLEVPAGGSGEAALLVPPLEPGPHGGVLRLATADRLEADDRLYWAIEVRRPRRVAVFHDPSVTAAAATEAQRIAALVSPPTLPADRRPFDVNVRSATAITAGGDAALAETDCAIVVNLKTIPEDMANRLAALAERGGLVLVVPGDRTGRGQGASGTLLPAEYLDRVRLEKPTRIELGGAAAFSDLLPRDVPGDPISARRVYRYVRTRGRPGAVALAQFGTGDVAMWGRSIGSSRVVQWSFSLNQAWGDLGTRAAPALVLIQSLASAVSDQTRRAANLLCEEGSMLSVDPAAALDALTVQRRSSDRSGEGTRTRRHAGPEAHFRAGADMAGMYEVDDESGALQAIFAVNLRPAETVGHRLSPEGVGAFFAPDAAVVVRERSELLAPTLTVAGDQELDGYVLLALLAVLLCEPMLANRFYRR
ncbi:MAG: BatA domain-containing protein [Phycisphaerae bacterium]